MFKVLLIIAALFSFSAHASEPELACQALGKTVRVIDLSPETLQRMGHDEGAAIIVRGDPVVVYDRTLLTEIKNHVIAHECAHHKLGHVNLPTIRSYTANEYLIENPADCLASKLLANGLGYGDKEFKVIVDYITTTMYNGALRAEIIQQCRR